MATIYEEIHGLTPKIEKIKREHIVESYARNVGVKEIKEAKYFKYLWQAFAWAAILGFSHRKRKPLQGVLSTEHFKYEQINNKGSDIFYSLILFAVAIEGYEILKDKSLLNKAIEEYANYGFDIVFTILKEKGNNYFNDDTNFLQEVLDRKIDIEKGEKINKDIEKKQNEFKVDDGKGNFFDM